MITIRVVAVVLVASLASPLAIAQEWEVEPPPAEGKGGQLKIFVLQGDGAVNRIKAPAVTQPIVEVRDERNQPVPGAEVSFELPMGGPSAFFAGQKLGWTGKTDANGQVGAAGMIANEEPGRFHIRVNASHGKSFGSAALAQTNSLRPVDREIGRKGVSGWWKAVGIIGAGAAAGGIVWGLSRDDRQTVVLQPGTISFGGPR